MSKVKVNTERVRGAQVSEELFSPPSISIFRRVTALMNAARIKSGMKPQRL